MNLLRRRVQRRTRLDRAGVRYIAAGAEEAERLGHNYVGTEHVLLSLTRNPQGGATRVLSQLGVTHRTIKNSSLLACVWAPRIDRDALAALGIDLDAVRERLEDTFGPGALDSARTLGPAEPGKRCIMPRLKTSLEEAVDRAGDEPLRDEHVLLGMLSVRDSLAARVLAELGVSLVSAEAVVESERP